ncbi:MAG: Gfo/Idh/MocA family oxidoreductase [Planctomycetaceae bacterium]|nr:Gfo/Idh/MocA family oxidoreductase [Planctomycetaceae bacterium]
MTGAATSASSAVSPSPHSHRPAQTDDKLSRRQALAYSAAWAGAVLAAETARAAASRRWRIGVIGHTGRGNYGHGLHSMWLAIPETEIVGLADADAGGRQQAQQQLGLNAAFADYRQMLAEIRPDIVAIGPRHIDQHRDMIIAAAESGARGIYCEKPFCRTPAEADEIVDACQQAGTRLALAHRNRYHPAVAVALEAARNGAIGRLLEVRCRGIEDERGGAQDLWVLGTHLFDLARPFAGDAVSCSATLLDGNRPVERNDIVEGAEGVGPIAGNRLHARYDLSSGIPLYFDSIRGAGVKAANFGLQLVGTEGLIDFRVDREPVAHLVPGNPFQPVAESRPWIPISSAGVGQPEPIGDMGPLVANHIFAARDLLAAIDEDRDPLSSAADGRAIVEMTHAALTSHVAGGARVSIPLASRGHGFLPWIND